LSSKSSGLKIFSSLKKVSEEIDVYKPKVSNAALFHASKGKGEKRRQC